MTSNDEIDRAASTPFRLTPFRKTVLRFFSALLIGVSLGMLVPKILGDEFVSRKIAKVVAPLQGYYYAPIRPARPKPPQITVVLLDDEALRLDNEPWPPSYDYYAKVLDQLTAYHPAAVFIDVIFASVRRGDGTNPTELRKSICALQEGGTKVFLAARFDEHRKLAVREGLRGELDRCAMLVAVEYQPDGIDGLAWAYDLRGIASHERFGELPDERRTVETESAALAIARHALGKPVFDVDDPLALTWGLLPHVDGIQWSLFENGGRGSEEYCERSDSGWTMLKAAMLHAVIPGVGKPACVFHRTVYTSAVLWPSADRATYLQESLTGNIVLIGTAFKGSNDIVISPLHDRIPGVYAHAMALDNLLESGPSYPRVEHARWGGKLEALAVMLAGLSFLFLLRMFKDAWGRVLRGARMRGFLHATDDLIFFGYLRTSPLWGRWGVRKSLEALGWIFAKVAECCVSMLVILLMLWAARYLGVGLLAAVEVLMFALVGEWLEWNELFVRWLTDDKERSHAHS